MTDWATDIDAPLFHRLVDGAAAISKECWLIPTNTALRCRCLNLSNTVYGNIIINATVEGEPAIIPIDVGKISKTVPTAGTVKVKHTDGIISTSVGKSRARFYDFAPSAVREAPGNLDRTLPNIVTDIPSKEFHDAVSAVINYCNDIAGAFYKVKLTVADVLTISDVEDNICIDIECDIQCPSGYIKVPNGYIKVSSLYMQPISQYIKKYTKQFGLQMHTPEHPLILTYSDDIGSFYTLIAPVVDEY